jgi:hypothetical protein
LTIGGHNAEAKDKSTHISATTGTTTVPHCTSSRDTADSTSSFTGSTDPPPTSVLPARWMKEQSPTFSATAPTNQRPELRNNIFSEYYLDVNYMFNKYNITTIINYTNLTNSSKLSF